MAERDGSPLGRRRYHALAVKLLAEGRLTQTEIAAACNVTQGAISQFASRYADEIQRVRDNANAELSSLWIADQRARVEQLQERIEQLIELAEEPLPPKFDVKGGLLIDPRGGAVVRDASTRIEATKEIRAGLRAVAEELGQLKPKLDLDGQTLRIELVGVDMDAV